MPTVCQALCLSLSMFSHLIPTTTVRSRGTGRATEMQLSKLSQLVTSWRTRIQIEV